MNGSNADTVEHLELLTELASCCEVVVEFGVRFGYSTKAFIEAKPKLLISYDIDPCDLNMDELKRLAKENGVKWVFRQQSSHGTVIPKCDLLFVDADHTYESVKKELELHKDKAKTIAFHDTVSFPDINRAIMEECMGWTPIANRTNCNGLLVIGNPAT